MILQIWIRLPRAVFFLNKIQTHQNTMVYPLKTNMTGWTILIFNGKYIDSNGGFSIVMFIFGVVTE